MHWPYDFTKRTAVITGAGSGVGKAITQALLHCGARVCVIGRRLDALTALTRDSAHAPQVQCYQADLALDHEVAELGVRLRRECERINILVHSAGVITAGTIAHVSSQDFDQQYRVNVRAPYVLTQALLGPLRTHRGQIVFINSSVGLRANANVGPYAASKHALKAIADSIRDEVNGDGVRVLSVYLGQTATPMQAALYAHAGKPYPAAQLLQADDVAATVLHTLSLPDTAEVTDIHLRPLRKPT